MDIEFYKEQLEAKEDMLARTTSFLSELQSMLEFKNTELNEVNKGIFDSIRFAKLIQTALLPDVDILKIYFKDASYKILQQIGIGGDFIFIKNTNQGILFGLFDCTGHGIPAAMLSIGGTLMLKEISSSLEINNPSVLIKLLNYQLHNTFNQNGQSLGHMEGIMCFFNSNTKELSYCSAKGKGFIIQENGELIELSSTRKSIGESSLAVHDYHEVKVSAGQLVFLYTDGLTDQFGGENDKKFSKNRLKEILKTNYMKSVDQLTEIIENEMNEWKDTKEQTDDLSFLILQV